MIKTKVIDKQNAQHYTWGAACDSWVLANSTGLSVKQEVMPSGSKEQLHFHHKAQQFFYILKGEATFYADNHKHILKPLQGISVSPMVKHFIANETDADIEFLVISQPTIGNDRVNL